MKEGGSVTRKFALGRARGKKNSSLRGGTERGGGSEGKSGRKEEGEN